MKKSIIQTISLIAISSLVTLAISGWFEANPVVGAIFGATLFFIVLSTLAAVMFYLGAAWTERQVKLGASIAQAAQEMQTDSDQKKTLAFAGFGRDMLRLGKELQNSNATLPLLPTNLDEGEQSQWLPPLNTLSLNQTENEYSDIEDL